MQITIVIQHLEQRISAHAQSERAPERTVAAPTENSCAVFECRETCEARTITNTSLAGRATAVAFAAMSVGCSGYNTESGCEADPSSPDLAVGESTEVEIEIVNGGSNSPDMAGGYWTTDSPVPFGASDRNTITGVATLVTGDGNTSEELTSRSISVEFASGEVVLFEGPISCN